MRFDSPAFSDRHCYFHPQHFWLEDAVLEYWPAPGAGNLIFYPGTMLAPSHYALFISDLRLAGFAVCAIHFPGHGLASKKTCLTFAHMLKIGLKAESWLKKNSNAHIAVVGHSQGGILAMWHAASSPALTCAFSITSIFPRMPQAIHLTNFAPLEKRRGQIMNTLKFLDKILPWLPVPLPFYLPLRKIVAGKFPPVRMGKGKGRFAYPLRFLVSLFDADIPHLLQCPWVLFSAKNDALFYPELIEATYALVNAPAKRLIWLEDGGHMAIMNPFFSQYIAKSAATICAGSGFPLNLKNYLL